MMPTWFLHLKIGRKLAASFCFLVVICMLVGGVGISNIRQLQKMDNDLYVYQTVPLLELRVVAGYFEQNRAVMRDAVLETDQQKLAQLIKTIDENTQKIDQAMASFAKSLLANEEKKEFAYFSNVIENFKYHRDQVLELCRLGNKNYALLVMKNDGPKLSSNFAQAIDNLSKMKENTGRETANLNADRAQKAIIYMGALIAGACILAIGFGTAITRVISKPLQAVAGAAERIAQGDLTHDIPPEYLVSEDETGELGRSVKAMRGNLYQIISNVKNESHELNTSMATAANNIDLLSQNLNEVHTVAQNLSISMQETAGVSTQMADISHSIKEEMDAMDEKAAEGADAAAVIMQRAATLKAGALKSQQIAADIQMRIETGLRTSIEQSQQVKEIATLADAILQIASQTNLLSLNASIEAARAGEAGRGFGVVAEEIRLLAENARSTVDNIQKVTRSVLVAVDNLAKNSSEALDFIATQAAEDYKSLVETGQQYSADAELFKNLAGDFVHTSEKISRNASTMLGFVEKVSGATGQGAKATVEIAQKASQVADKADEINTLAGSTRKSSQRLSETVSRFRLDK